MYVVMKLRLQGMIISKQCLECIYIIYVHKFMYACMCLDVDYVRTTCVGIYVCVYNVMHIGLLCLNTYTFQFLFLLSFNTLFITHSNFYFYYHSIYYLLIHSNFYFYYHLIYYLLIHSNSICYN